MDDDKCFSEKRIGLMLKIYLWLHSPETRHRFRDGFRSKNHLARAFDNSPNPSPLTKLVVSDMMDASLLVIDRNDFIVLDDDAFEDFIARDDFGKVLIQYVDEISNVTVRM